MTGSLVLPIYLACDCSSGIDQYRPLVDECYRLGLEPLAAHYFRVGAFVFGERADVWWRLVSLLDLGSTYSEPRDNLGRSVRFGPLFDCVRIQADVDIAALRLGGVRIARPMLFLLSHKNPDDEWEAAYESLMGQPWHPHIISIDLGATSISTQRRIGKAAYRASEIGAVARLVGDYVADAFRSRSSSQAGWTLPAHIEGLNLVWRGRVEDQ